MVRGALGRQALDEIAGLALGKKFPGRATAKRFSYRAQKRSNPKRKAAKRKENAKTMKRKTPRRKAVAKKQEKKHEKARAEEQGAILASSKKKTSAKASVKKASSEKRARLPTKSKTGIHIKRLEEIERTIQRLIMKRKAEPKSEKAKSESEKAKPEPIQESKAEKAKSRAASIAVHAVRARTHAAKIDPGSAEELSRNVFSMVQRTKALSGEPIALATGQKKPGSAMPAAGPQMFPRQIVQIPMPEPGQTYGVPVAQRFPLPPRQAFPPEPSASAAIPRAGRSAFPAPPTAFAKRIPSFIEALDNAFMGGFQPNSTIVIDSLYQAEAKLLMIQLASLALRNSEPVLYISLDDSAEGISSKANRSGLEFSSYYSKGLLYFIDGFSRFYGQSPQATEQISRIAGPTALAEMSSATMKSISNFFLFGRYYKVAQAISEIGDAENDSKGIQAYPKVFLDSVSTLFYFFQPNAVQRFLLSEKSKLGPVNAVLFTVHNSRLFPREANEALRQNAEYYITLERENESILLRIESSITPVSASEVRLRLTSSGFERA